MNWRWSIVVLLHACHASGSIEVLGTAGLDSVELLVLDECPSGPADILECRAVARDRILVGFGERSARIPNAVGAHAIAVLGYRQCSVVGWACVPRPDGVDDVRLQLAPIASSSTPRCGPAACGPQNSCSIRCGNADGDDDGDGLSNDIECQGALSTCPDVDGDTLPNYLDDDADGDGYSDRFECPSRATCDSNSNGLDDPFERQPSDDYDLDGLPNSLECDPNRSTSSLTACTDTDRDGLVDVRDTDSDGDGYADNIECPYFAEEMSCPDFAGAPDQLVPGPARCGVDVCGPFDRCIDSECCNVPFEEIARGSEYYLYRPRPVGDLVGPPSTPPMDAVPGPQDPCLYVYPTDPSLNWNTAAHPLLLIDTWYVDNDGLPSIHYLMISYRGPAFWPGENFPLAIRSEQMRTGIRTRLP